MLMPEQRRLSLAGVPTVIHPPRSREGGEPVLVLWHGFGPPGSAQALAELLPLDDVPAWKIYPALPLLGERLAAGGADEIMRRQLDDYLLQLLLPIVEQAVGELPALVDELRRDHGAGDSSGIGLLGFSAGAVAVIHALLDGSMPVRTAVLVGAPPDLDRAVANFERAMRAHADDLRARYPWFRADMLRYSWSEASRAARSRLALGSRAGELATRNPPPALLVVHAERDEMYPVAELRSLGATVSAAYGPQRSADRVSVQTFAHLAHHLTPTTSGAGEERDLVDVRAAISAWCRRHLME